VGRLKVLLSVTILIFPISSQTFAQKESPLTADTPIRVSSPVFVTFKTFTDKKDTHFTGTVITIDADTLVIKANGWGLPVSIPLTSVSNLEVAPTKKKARFQGMLLGAWVGSAVGAEIVQSNGKSPYIGAVAGSVVSGFAGYLIGSLFKIKKWEQIQVRGFNSTGSTQPHNRSDLALTTSLTFE